MNVTDLTPEKFIKATLKQQGRTVRWLANELGMNEDLLSRSLGDSASRPSLNAPRRAAAAKALSIPDFIVRSWEQSQSTPQEGAA